MDKKQEENQLKGGTGVAFWGLAVAGLLIGGSILLATWWKVKHCCPSSDCKCNSGADTPNTTTSTTNKTAA